MFFQSNNFLGIKDPINIFQIVLQSGFEECFSMSFWSCFMKLFLLFSNIFEQLQTEKDLIAWNIGITFRGATLRPWTKSNGKNIMKDSILVKLQAVGCEMFLENFLAQKKNIRANMEPWQTVSECMVRQIHIKAPSTQISGKLVYS